MPTQKAVDTYTVPADQPRIMTIPAINVNARVKAVGVTKDNAMGTPANVYDAGWFNQSSKPGQDGAMVIDGHVSSESAHGVFYDLKKLKSGDTITIERGDHTTLNYSVVTTKTYDYNNVDMLAVLRPVDPDKPGLNLITCGGSVIKGTHEFDKRVVVFAKQL